MFNLSGSEIIFLIIIALVVLGPDKLPDAMRKAGKAYGDFKRMTTGFQSEMKSVLDEPMRELRETADLAKKSAMFDTSSITKPLSGTMSDAKPAPVASGNMPVRTAAPSEPPAAVPIAAPETAAEQPAAVESAAAEPVSKVADSASTAAEPVVAKPTVAATTPAPEAASIDDTIASLDATARRLARMAQDADTASDSSNSSRPLDGAPIE